MRRDGRRSLTWNSRFLPHCQNAPAMLILPAMLINSGRSCALHSTLLCQSLEQVLEFTESLSPPPLKNRTVSNSKSPPPPLYNRIGQPVDAMLHDMQRLAQRTFQTSTPPWRQYGQRPSKRSTRPRFIDTVTCTHKCTNKHTIARHEEVEEPKNCALFLTTTSNKSSSSPGRKIEAAEASSVLTDATHHSVTV